MISRLDWTAPTVSTRWYLTYSTHARGTCLADVVEVSVWNFLLGRQLLHLIQKDVHLEFRA